MFQVLIDSTSKWLEVLSMLKTTTASAVIKLLSKTFTRFRLPRVAVSDNPPVYE